MNPSAKFRNCEHPSCDEEGVYRAPKSRDNLRSYLWFCLDHIREYNSSWDFYKDMSGPEILEHRLADMLWRRPTWSKKKKFDFSKVIQGVYEHPLLAGIQGGFQEPLVSNGFFPLPPRQSRAFKAIRTLSLSYPFTLEELKKNYAKLVKKHHPDRNDGCKKSEEKLKLITIAYQDLMVYLKPFL